MWRRICGEPLPELNKQVLDQKPDAVAALSPALRFQIVFHRDLSNRFRSRGEQGVDVDTFLRSSSGWELKFWEMMAAVKGLVGRGLSKGSRRLLGERGARGIWTGTENMSQVNYGFECTHVLN